MPKKIPRGLRNNNPGNIRISKDKWQGLAADQLDDEFFTFKDPTYGIRAMARIIIKYQDDYGCNSVRKIIDRWAPPVENNTTAYINAVAEDIGVTPKQVINVHDYDVLFPLVKAIIQHENGYQPYSDAQITKGLTLAGVEAEGKKSIIKDKKVVAASSTGALTLVSMGAEHIEKAAPAFSLMSTMAEYAPYILGLVVLIVAGFIIWDRIEDRKKGLM